MIKTEEYQLRLGRLARILSKMGNLPLFSFEVAVQAETNCASATTLRQDSGLRLRGYILAGQINDQLSLFQRVGAWNACQRAKNANWSAGSPRVSETPTSLLTVYLLWAYPWHHGARRLSQVGRMGADPVSARCYTWSTSAAPGCSR